MGVVRTATAAGASTALRGGGFWLPSAMKPAIAAPRIKRGSIQPTSFRTIFMTPGISVHVPSSYY
jgi:hypothetical protein